MEKRVILCYDICDNEYPLEEIRALPNQRVIITVVDEFVEPSGAVHKKSMRGVLARYADPELKEKEKGAWERAAAEKHMKLLSSVSSR